MNRRQALQRSFQIVGGTVLGGCIHFDDSTGPDVSATRLLVRPGTNPTFLSTKGIGYFSNEYSSGMYYVPTTASRTTPMPLVIFLHGALKNVDYFVSAFAPVAESAGVMVLAPYSNGNTWDAIHGPFGPDVSRIDGALQWTFDRWLIDPARMVMSGFSDGAAYSLAIGRANGDLFSRVVAYSPGSIFEVETFGLPPILITHGTVDEVIPYEMSAELIVPDLTKRGYAVDFRPFNGGHAVPLSAANDVMTKLGSET